MKIPHIIQAELDKWGFSYNVIDGGAHMKLFIGDTFVGILPKNARKDSQAGRGGLNVRSNIRRLGKRL